MAPCSWRERQHKLGRSAPVGDDLSVSQSFGAFCIRGVIDAFIDNDYHLNLVINWVNCYV